MKQYARTLRRDANSLEEIVWSFLRDRKLYGLKFRRQHALGRFVTDFYCAEAKVAVELDGLSHEGTEVSDLDRQRWVEEQGIRVMRLENHEVYENLEGALEVIGHVCKERRRELQIESRRGSERNGDATLRLETRPLTPTLSPEGRGRERDGDATLRLETRPLTPALSPEGRGSEINGDATLRLETRPLTPALSPEGRGRERLKAHVRRVHGVTLIEMLVVVALTVLMMSIIAEVFVLASETLSQLRSMSDINQKVRSVESVIRMDLANRTIRVVQPPVERKASIDGVPGTVDDFFVPVGFDPSQGFGYFTLIEDSPADENGEDSDDVIAFTVKLMASAQASTVGVGGTFPAYVGRAVSGSEPDVAFAPAGDRLAGSQEAEVIYFLRGGTLYRRVLLVGVPQPTDIPNNNPSTYTPRQSWYNNYDISARPAPTTTAGPPWPIPIVNTLSDLTYRSARYLHELPTNYNVGYPAAVPPVDPGLATDMAFPGNNFPFRPLSFLDTQTGAALGAGWHDNQGADADKQVDHNRNFPQALNWTPVPELFNGRPTLRETSSPNWNFPDDSTSTFFVDYWAGGNPLHYLILNNTAQRPAEDAILTNVLSFDIKVFDPDAIPNGSVLATGDYVDLGKMWPGASGSVTTPGPTPTNGTPSGFPGNAPSPVNGPMPGTWPPARRPNVLNPDHRGFGEPFGYDSTNSPPYAIPPGTVQDMPLGMYRAPISLCRTYDTWCTAYTKPTQVGVVPVAPPYIVPLRGIQIKIRFADPTTRMTREITIVQELQ